MGDSTITKFLATYKNSIKFYHFFATHLNIYLPVINDAGEVRANHWHFNAYGGFYDGLYFPWDKDEQIALKMAEFSGVRRYRPDSLILEGGSITVDGEGTCVVTDMCP